MVFKLNIYNYLIWFSIKKKWLTFITQKHIASLILIIAYFQLLFSIIILKSNKLRIEELKKNMLSENKQRIHRKKNTKLIPSYNTKNIFLS